MNTSMSAFADELIKIADWSMSREQLAQGPSNASLRTMPQGPNSYDPSKSFMFSSKDWEDKKGKQVTHLRGEDFPKSSVPTTPSHTPGGTSIANNTAPTMTSVAPAAQGVEKATQVVKRPVTNAAVKGEGLLARGAARVGRMSRLGKAGLGVAALGTAALGGYEAAS